MTPEERISQAGRDLAEHFDCVQVFVQLHDVESDSTDVWDDGRGNTLARHAQVQEWLNHCDRELSGGSDDEELTT